MIELGLPRIQALLQRTPQTWKAIHVAGTNGKGSICAYLTAMLRANNVSCGKFTSPHLVDRWDCISVNDKVIRETQFRQFEDMIKKRNEDLRVGATEFELLTATAFEIFEAEKVQVGVIEVGLGGRLDATNVLKDKVVTVISKIGLDHQSILGNTLEEIALQKAGIMRNGVPCVIDGSNPQAVHKVIEAYGQETGAILSFVSPESSDLVRELKSSLEPHQAQNLATAHEAFRLAYPQYAHSADILVPAVRNTSWPGRLQMLDIESVTRRKQKILLDGAHNPQSAEVLANFVNRHLRTGDAPNPITWVLAATEGKDLMEMLKRLIQPGDQAVAIEFGPVDGMPWIRPMKSEEVLNCAARLGISFQHDSGSDILDALTWASNAAAGGRLVVAGSLYLVSDVLRLIRRQAT